MKASYSRGHDQLSNMVVKLIYSHIGKSLTLIINQSLYTGIFSDSMKIAKFVPIYKKALMNNYLTCFDTTLVSTLEAFGVCRLLGHIQRSKNSELANIYGRLSLNYINLNVNKFHKHPKVIPVLNIQMNNVKIDRVSEFKFLYVILMST